MSGRDFEAEQAIHIIPLIARYDVAFIFIMIAGYIYIVERISKRCKAKEKPRRHLFFDKGMECWCIAHICHSDEGVYAKSCSTSVASNYLTMGQDQKARCLKTRQNPCQEHHILVIYVYVYVPLIGSIRFIGRI